MSKSVQTGDLHLYKISEQHGKSRYIVAESPDAVADYINHYIWNEYWFGLGDSSVRAEIRAQIIRRGGDKFMGDISYWDDMGVIEPDEIPLLHRLGIVDGSIYRESNFQTRGKPTYYRLERIEYIGNPKLVIRVMNEAQERIGVLEVGLLRKSIGRHLYSGLDWGRRQAHRDAIAFGLTNIRSRKKAVQTNG